MVRDMARLANLNLIHFFDFYLLFFFMVGTARRMGQYYQIVQFAFTGPGRWPKLLHLISQHRTIFMTWATIAPALLAMALAIAQLVASRLVWPDAGRPPGGLTVGRVAENWPSMFMLLPLGLAMIALDLYFVIRVAEVPKNELETYFDQAEYWLRSHTAHVVRVFTLGFVHPRRMVADEVRKALIAASALLNQTLWWVNLQMGLRFAFGVTVWVTWAFTPVR
jgi:hypothetical protein